MRLVLESSKPVEQALVDLNAAVKANGFGVLHTYDLKQTLAAKGFDLPESCHILEICNPQQALNVLSQDMGMNIALPCRVSVYTEAGRTKIAMAKPTALLSALSDSPELAKVAAEVEQKIAAMMRAAA